MLLALAMKTLTSVLIGQHRVESRNELAFKAQSKISGACCRFAVANHQLFDRFAANHPRVSISTVPPFVRPPRTNRRINKMALFSSLGAFDDAF